MPLFVITMENNLVVVVEDQFKDVLSFYEKIRELKYICQNIDYAIKHIKQKYFNIGECLKRIVDEKLIPEGFNNIYDFAQARFGFGITWTKNVIAVFEKFSEPNRDYYYSVPEEFEKVPFSNLVELLPVSDDKELCKLLSKRPKQAIRDAKKYLENVDENQKVNTIKIQNSVNKMLIDELKRQASFLCFSNTFWDENNKLVLSINYDNQKAVNYKISLSISNSTSLSSNFSYCSNILDNFYFTKFVSSILENFFQKSKTPKGFSPKLQEDKTYKLVELSEEEINESIIDILNVIESDVITPTEISWRICRYVFGLTISKINLDNFNIFKFECGFDDSVLYFDFIFDSDYLITTLNPISIDTVKEILKNVGLDEETVSRLTNQEGER